MPNLMLFSLWEQKQKRAAASARDGEAVLYHVKAGTLAVAARRITFFRSHPSPEPSAAAFPLTRSLTPAHAMPCHALMHTSLSQVFLLWARGHGLSVGALPLWVARRTAGNGLDGTAEQEQSSVPGGRPAGLANGAPEPS